MNGQTEGEDEEEGEEEEGRKLRTTLAFCPSPFTTACSHDPYPGA